MGERPLPLAANLKVQPKLAVGQPDDPLEHEADRVADAVLRMPATGARNGVAAGLVGPAGQGRPPEGACAHEHDQIVRRALADDAEWPEAEATESDESIPTASEEEHEEVGEIEAEAVVSGTDPELGQADADGVMPVRQPGSPLPDSVRGFFESRFGRDFSDVRVHTGAAAGESTQALNARAYTVGSDIVFGARQYAPGTAAGQRLLAHELAHVAQQGSLGTPRVLRQDDKPQKAPAKKTPTKAAPAKKAPTKAAPAKKAPPPPSGFTESQVQVLPAKTGSVSDPSKSAETKVTVKFTYKYTAKGGTVQRFSGKVTKTIRTTYAPGVKKTAPSGYGRGTTDADKKASNTSLEFHENRHVADFQEYLKQNQVPAFAGKEGMSESEFKQAVADYETKLNEYSAAAQQQTKQQTDCVGTKEASCE